MPVSVRSSALAAFLVSSLASAAVAGDGFYLPPAPVGPGGEDVIETAGGTRCRQSINANGAYLDVGVGASHSSGSAASAYGPVVQHRDNGSEALGYARLVVPLGKRPERIDCSRVYEMEIARMRREIELLRLAAE